VQETKRTPRRERGGRATWQGSSERTGLDRVRSSPPVPGRPRAGEEQTQREGGASPSGGLVTEEHREAQDASSHTPGARAHREEHPRHASPGLQGGQAAPRGGRTRPAVQHEVRSQSGGAPRGAEARAAVGSLVLDFGAKPLGTLMPTPWLTGWRGLTPLWGLPGWLSRRRLGDHPQIVGDHAPADPAFHSGHAMIPAPV
jgi:hypothetical protein